MALGGSGEPSMLAGFILAAVDPEDVVSRRSLLDGLRDDCDRIRILAATVLGLLQPPPQDAVPHLITALNRKYESANVKRTIIETLANYAGVSADAVAALAAATRDRNEWTALAAVRALGAAGPAARDAVPALERLLRDGNDWPHEPSHVREALSKIDPGPW